jgi:hypothetical protein
MARKIDAYADTSALGAFLDPTIHEPTGRMA